MSVLVPIPPDTLDLRRRAALMACRGWVARALQITPAPLTVLRRCRKAPPDAEAWPVTMAGMGVYRPGPPARVGLVDGYSIRTDLYVVAHEYRHQWQHETGVLTFDSRGRVCRPELMERDANRFAAAALDVITPALLELVGGARGRREPHRPGAALPHRRDG